ncbi:MAG: amidohydrolase [Deltaproteobacteria bacterium]|nr:amidohydrolase [Deltaproteobacteria bacterium]
MVDMSLPGVNDSEGERIPDSLPSVVDAHVHLFPDAIFGAIRQWFDQYAWPIRYRMGSEDLVRFLLSREIDHVVGLHYAHKPGIARRLNEHMAGLAQKFPRLTGTATVFPGEDETQAILEDAFSLGLTGVKLHAHVQGFRMDGEAMFEICEICDAHRQPLIMHVGREPRNPHFAYPVDPYLICRADLLEEILRSFPGLKVCVPHLGADEFTAYRTLLEKYDNLWVDTAMMLADYLPVDDPPRLEEFRPERVMYGTDFPQIPYAWDRELKRIGRLGLSEDHLALILKKNALEFFSISG